MLRPGRGSGAGSAVPSSGPHSLLVPIPVSTGGALRLVRRRFAIGRSEGALHRLRQGLGWGVPMFVSFLCLHSIPSTPGICHGLRALGMKISRSHRLCSRKTRAEVITDLLILYYPATPNRVSCQRRFLSHLLYQPLLDIGDHFPYAVRFTLRIHFSLLNLSNMNAHLRCAFAA